MEKKFQFEVPSQKPEEKDKRKATKKEAEKILKAVQGDSGFDDKDFEEVPVSEDEDVKE